MELQIFVHNIFQFLSPINLSWGQLSWQKYSQKYNKDWIVIALWLYLLILFKNVSIPG